eukprot:gene2252-2552_t
MVLVQPWQAIHNKNQMFKWAASLVADTKAAREDRQWEDKKGYLYVMHVGKKDIKQTHVQVIHVLHVNLVEKVVIKVYTKAVVVVEVTKAVVVNSTVKDKVAAVVDIKRNNLSTWILSHVSSVSKQVILQT